MSEKLKVIFFHRRPRKGNFSVEILFNEIRKCLPEAIHPVVATSSWESNGLFRRVKIGLQARKRQSLGEVNHVTGDINFVSLFLKKTKTVLTILDVGFLSHPNWLARKVLKLFWLTLPAKRCKLITTISQATKNEVLKHTKIHPEKIKVVYVPVSQKFEKGPIKDFSYEKPVLLQIGTKPNKNVPRLIEAVKDLDCHLEIVGGLSDEISNALTNFKVSYTNAVGISEEELIKKYHGSDIVTFTSTYEGFGMPIVEANIIGRPVITSNLLSMPEVAGDAAHLVNPYDVESMKAGILELIQNADYRNRLVINGFENHKRFQGTVIANQLAEIYLTLKSK